MRLFGLFGSEGVEAEVDLYCIDEQSLALPKESMLHNIQCMIGYLKLLKPFDGSHRLFGNKLRPSRESLALPIESTLHTIYDL